MKKFLLSILTVLLVLGSGTNFSAEVNTENSSSPLDSPENYINYLKEYNEQEALNSGVSIDQAAEAVAKSQEVLEAFLDLPREKQEKLLEVLRDEELVAAIYKGDFEKLPAEIRDEFYWTEEVTLESPEIGLNANQHVITHTGNLTGLGITLVGYKITGRYEFELGNGATRSLSTEPIVDYNYNPSVDTGINTYNGYVSGGVYHGLSSFYYRIGIQGVGGVQLGNVYLNVYGDERGKKYGEFWTQ